ncbi:MAG: hypothetical protein P8X42_04635, partial [Calditrichaceae bacterium]
MKRFLITTSILITFLGLVLTASPYLLKFFGIDNSVKRYILSEVIDNSKGQLDVKNFQIGLGTVKLSDVSLQSGSNGVQVSMEAIEFNFNFFKIFSSPAHPQNAIETIYLKKPRLTLSTSQSDTLKDVSLTELDKNQIKNIFSSISKLSAIDKIQISDGQILWQDADKKIYPLVEDLNGWLTANGLDDMNIEAKGCLFSTDDENFYMNSQIDFDHSRLDASILINKYEVNSSAYPFVPETVSLDSGLISGTLNLQNSGFVIDSTVINGEININKLDFNYAGYAISDINLRSKIDTNAVLIKNSEAFFENDKFIITGNIDNILNPKIVADIKMTDLDLYQLTSAYNIDFLKNSHVNSSLHIEYGQGIRSAIIKAWTNDLLVGNRYHVEDFDFSATYNPDLVRINRIAGIFNDFLITGDGLYNSKENLVSVNLASRHTFGNHILLDRLTDKRLKFDMGLSMNTKTGLVRGLWDYLLVNTNDTLLAVQGNIKGDDNHLTVSLLNSNQPDFFANVEITNYLKSLTISNARIVNFPFAEFTTNSYLKNPVSRFNTDMQLTFNLNTNIENLLSDERNYSGKITIKNLSGDFRILHKADFLGGAFNFSNEINGFIKIDVKNEEQLAGEVEFKKFKFIQALADSVFKGSLQDQAEIDGTIKLSGDLNQPKLDAELFADKIMINDVGYYQIKTDMDYEDGLITANDLIFYLNNLPILNGTLAYVTSDQSISGDFKGNEIDLEPIVRTIHKKEPDLIGLANYNIQIDGFIKEPKLKGQLNISKGELRGVPFDHFNLAFADSVKKSGSITEIKDHVLNFRDLNFEKTGNYQLTASGIIPFNRIDPLSVKGQFTGDILGFVPRLNGFFLDGTSLAEMEFQLGGTTNRIRFKKGYVTIEKGELWLDKVVPHIENIHGRIDVTEGTNQVNFKNLVAEVNGETVTINTVRDVTLASGDKLENWYFKGTDLDFGILQLETSGKGIAVNIPGLMLDEDRAHFYLSGMNDNEKFYFAGPAKHPRVRGQLSLYDSRFTFPFLTIEKPGSKPSVVVEFLENINWDILVKSGEDVVYFRDIPAYIDKVYTEVYIDESSEGIHFKGIIDNGTFQPIGFASSSRGRLEYLDQNFRVDHFDVEFSQNDILPYVSGRAWTTIRDSVGAIPKTIYLQLYVIDPETGEEKQQGSWEDFKFKLVSAEQQLG